MNKAIVILAVLSVSWASPVEQTVIFNEDGSYKFNFDTGKDHGSHFREEERQPDGTVVGRYSYEDPTGSVRVVNYRAGRQGFVATGDVGVAGAAPAQVPAVLPPEAPIKEQPLEEDPSQDIHPGSQDDEDKPKNLEKPVDPLTEDVVPDHPQDDTETPKKPTDDTPKPEDPESDQDNKDQLSDDAGRKREAGSPPISYSDGSYPFSAPLFGKRRLDFPEDDVSDKAQAAVSDEDGEKKPDPVKPPTTFVYHFGSPFVPQIPAAKPVEDKKAEVIPETNPNKYYYYVPTQPESPFAPQTPAAKPEPIEDKKAEVIPETKPDKYYYYVPSSPALGFFPSAPFSHGSQFAPASQFAHTKFQQPSVQSQFHSGPPKAWAYVPISSLNQQQEQSYQPQQVPAQPFQFVTQPQHFAAQPQHFGAQAQHFGAQPQHFGAQTQHFGAQPQHFGAQTQHFGAQPQQQAILPQSHPTTWAYIQPHAVTYIPASSNAGKPDPAAPSPAVPSGPASDDQSKPQVNTAPVESDPVKPSEPAQPQSVGQTVVSIDQAGQVPFQSTFYHRPAVQHYSFKGPSNTYGYYYQY